MVADDQRCSQAECFQSGQVLLSSALPRWRVETMPACQEFLTAHGMLNVSAGENIGEFRVPHAACGQRIVALAPSSESVASHTSVIS